MRLRLAVGLLCTLPSCCMAGSARIAVASQDDASISEIDASGSVVRVAVGHGPAGIAVSPDASRIYVTYPDGKAIGIIDTRRGTLATTIPFPGEPFGIAADEDAFYASDWAADTVTRFDARSGATTGTVSTGRGPAGMVLDPGRHRLYVANRDTGDVSIIDANSMVSLGTVASGASPFALALSPDGLRLYVANVRSNDLAIIDTLRRRRVASVPIGPMPYGVAVTADGATILVTNQHANTLSLVDARTLRIVAAIPVGRYPEGVLTADGGIAYVANWFSGDISLVDLVGRREVRRIKVGDGPRMIARLAERRLP